MDKVVSWAAALSLRVGQGTCPTCGRCCSGTDRPDSLAEFTGTCYRSFNSVFHHYCRIDLSDFCPEPGWPIWGSYSFALEREVAAPTLTYPLCSCAMEPLSRTDKERGQEHRKTPLHVSKTTHNTVFTYSNPLPALFSSPPWLTLPFL